MTKVWLKDKNRTAGSNQECSSLTFLVAVGTVAGWRVAVGTVLRGTVGTGTASHYVGPYAAFGVFFEFEVLDFDRFLTCFCCHSVRDVYGLCSVSAAMKAATQG